MKIFLTLGAMTALVATLGAADPLGELIPGKDKVVALGVGLQVKRGELDAAVRIYLMNAAAEGNVILPDERTMERNLLDDLVITRILKLRATNSDKNAAYAKAREGYLKERNKYSSGLAFKIRVGAMGITTNVFRERLYNSMVAKVVFDREVTAKVLVTDVQAQAFYNQNKADWTTLEYVKTAHVLLATVNPFTGVELSKADKARKRQQALLVRQRALAGQKFAKLVEEFSEDAITRKHGGEMTSQRGVLPENVEKIVFAMRPGQISGVVETALGFNIIRLIERKPTTVKPYGEVKAEIKKTLADAEARKRLPGFYTQLRKAAKVEIFLDDK